MGIFSMVVFFQCSHHPPHPLVIRKNRYYMLGIIENEYFPVVRRKSNLGFVGADII